VFRLAVKSNEIECDDVKYGRGAGLLTLRPVEGLQPRTLGGLTHPNELFVRRCYQEIWLKILELRTKLEDVGTE
jgi:hypothetical protein